MSKKVIGEDEHDEPQKQKKEFWIVEKAELVKKWQQTREVKLRGSEDKNKCL